MLKLRVLTVLVVLPVFVAALFLLSNSWWSTAVMLPLLIAGHEWAKLAAYGRKGELAFLAVLLAGYAILWITAAGGKSQHGGVYGSADTCVYVLSAAFWFFIAPYCLRRKISIGNPLAMFLAGLVVLLPASLSLARLQNSPKILLALLAIVWIADTAAYFAGRALGRHKLAPAISPGKTWEGVGGALVAVTVYAVAIHTLLFSTYELAIVIASFLAIGYFGIIGDLFESWLKRNAGVKDSGDIFPGHGGMLDRIDAITAALPLAALIFI